MSMFEHWDSDPKERLREAAEFIISLLRHEPAGTDLANDACQWLREFEMWVGAEVPRKATDRHA